MRTGFTRKYTENGLGRAETKMGLPSNDRSVPKEN
jgi:hypothetical protein